MLKLYKTIICNSKSNKVIHNVTSIKNYLSSTVEVRKVQNLQSESNDINDDTTSTNIKSNLRQNKNLNISNSNMVAAAFASLKTNSTNMKEIPTPVTDNRITEASTVNELLSICQGSGVSRRHALQVVSILADWSTKNKVQLSDFEMDPRFLKLCKVLTHGSYNIKKMKNYSRNDDLNTILNVTADDEAAKLIATLTLTQMVKVMSSLALKKRRSLSLLRSLSYNITKNSDQLNLKQSADVLYSMAILNFPDENLLNKVSADVLTMLNSNSKGSAVIGSILTSAGLLKYKNSEMLEALSTWIFKNYETCRPQDACALILTLAMLNYEPSNASALYKAIIPQVTAFYSNEPHVWLEIVWSLVVLNKATSEQIASVLNNNFVERFGDDTSMSCKLKLLNIDAASRLLMKDYTGPKLEASNIKSLKLHRSRDKEEFAKSVVETLKNLIQPENLKTNVNTEMGFYIDAECVVDEKCSPIAFEKASAVPSATKIAIMVYDYHDLCIGRTEPTGINSLASNLLNALGYTLLSVPFHEFKSNDRLVARVKYLESKLKSTVNK